MGLQRAEHAQPGIAPGSALLIQDPWIHTALGESPVMSE